MTPRSGFEEFLRVMLTAAEMVDDLDGQRAREAAAFREGYRLGFGGGREVGERRVVSAAMLAHDDVVADLAGRRPSRSYSELELIRWDGPRRDFGKPRPGDYMGGPVDWETGRPAGRGTAA
ncbi:hypothetical protein [Actinomadura geliboluensis]|uniref:hypothetical protein n=1 Tax=Actinomadura geliboluensis TaxID=882440 RepID=UPI0037186AE6